jgi:uncharacterized protein YlxW (UPF0749 family)
MNPYEMVAVIVVAVMMASVLRARFGHSRRHRRGEDDAVSVQEQAENLRLREEVKALKDRLQVLERIAVEKEDTLSRQIEELRDR